MILDFHTHVDEAPAFGWIDPPDKIVGLMDTAGIDAAVIMTYTDLPGLNPAALEYIVEAAGAHQGRLHPFVRLNPNYTEAVPGIIDTAVTLGVRGVKLHPTTTLAHPASEPTLSVLRRCAELGWPVLFHCGDDPYTTPQTLRLAAEEVPGCAVVLGHMGGYLHVEDAIEAAAACPNLYLETSAMPYPAQIARAVERIGAERVLFGSDGPGCNPALELAKVRSAGLTGPDEAAVLGENAVRLLGVAA